MKRNLGAVLAAGFGLFVTVTPLVAHHSFAAEFDEKKPIKVTGVVKAVEWQNPHIWFYVNVKIVLQGYADMRQHFAVSFVAVAIVIGVMALAQTPAAAQSALARQAVPRTPDGKPDFTGVWAGPGFSHKVGPNDTDTPQVT